MTAKALKEHPLVGVPANQDSDCAGLMHDESVLAFCVDTRHPTLLGRVRVRWLGKTGEPYERWVPVLRTVVVREHDRVLLVRPVNEAEPVVVGVVDGFARRPEPPQTAGFDVELKSDQVFRLTSERGQPVLEVALRAEGPVVRLLSADTQVELPGKLRISAAEIELTAATGSVRINANDDVEINGEMIRLN